MTTPEKGRIFISYRRIDTSGYAGRIFDRLSVHFGKDAIFMDVNTIEAGLDFVTVLENAVQSCDVLVALIGWQWLNLKDEDGNRRLDNPEDFVRVEIEAALSRDIRVIPVLVNGARMPRSVDLPEKLKPLSRRNNSEVTHRSFDADVHHLAEQLELALRAAEHTKAMKARALTEREAHAQRQAKIEKLATQADTAINMQDWQLAEKKLRNILALDSKNIQAQAKLELIEEKLTEIEAERKRKESKERENERERVAGREREKAKEERRKKATAEKVLQDRVAREKEIAEEKMRQDALKKARQQERAEGIKKLFQGRGALIGVGVLAFACLIFGGNYIFENISAPVVATRTKKPPTESPATVVLAIETSTKIATEIPYTPTPALGVGSTMLSEKDGMTLLYVPAGEFEMGGEQYDDEKPVHTVYLDEYWIDQTEVTNKMFVKFVNDTEYVTDAEEAGKSYVYEDGSWTQKSGADWQHPAGSESSISALMEHPVIHVSWHDANDYCTWAERRLPTEAEWEKAARGGLEGKQYPWGDDAPVCEQGAVNGAKFDDNAGCDDTGTEEIGSYSANGYGIYDMSGNVWEWVDDWYSAYPGNTIENSSYGTTYRVLRGGSWYYIEDYLRSADRSRCDPTDTNDYYGFRCSRSP